MAQQFVLNVICNDDIEEQQEIYIKKFIKIVAQDLIAGDLRASIRETDKAMFIAENQRSTKH